jgi:hypothetical protein
LVVAADARLAIERGINRLSDMCALEHKRWILFWGFKK